MTVADASGEGHRLDPRFKPRNHSPSGFGWGYGGGSPAQLTLAAGALDVDEAALAVYQRLGSRVAG